jgi:hypothetical protein
MEIFATENVMLILMPIQLLNGDHRPEVNGIF